MPIFVVGPARSGTTLVRVLLGGHHRIAAIDELNFASLVVRAHEMLLAQTSALARIDDFDVQRARIALLEAHRSPRDAIARARAKVRWVDSTHTANERYPDVLDDLYDGECRFVLVRRHPADVVASHMERWPEHGLDACAKALGRVALVQSRMCLVIPERVTIVRYEDVVAAPDDTMRVLLTALGEDVEGYSAADALARGGPRVRVGDHRIRDRAVISAESVGRWSSTLSDGALRALSEHGGFVESLAAWGYAT